jgi:hypothetical protein
MNYRSQVVCAWCGPLMTLGFFIGLWPLAHFIWPPAPSAGAAEIAAFFQTDTVLKRLGLFIAMVCTGLLAPFYAVISVQMKRIENVSLPLTYTQLVAGACTVLEIVLPMMLWQGIAYRPDRDPVVTQALNDVAWLTFLGLTTTVLIQNVVWGVVIMQDKAERPIFPRWFAYFNFFCVAGVFPAGLVPFFKSGPLAWDGIIVWGIGVTVFFVWIVLGAVLIHGAARRQRDEFLAAASADATRVPTPA